MTEAAFFGWIRSLLRMRYMRGWKPHNEVAKDNRRAIKKRVGQNGNINVLIVMIGSLEKKLTLIISFPVEH